MPALKYWDGSAWQPLLGAGGGAIPPPSYRQLVYTAKDDTQINVNATSYGAFIGPQVDAYVGANGAALINFYAQTGYSGGSDLIVTFSVIQGGTSVINASDNNCLYGAPSPNGPGFISGIMLALGLAPGLATFYIHQRVSVGSTSMLRRRMAVIPHMLTT